MQDELELKFSNVKWELTEQDKASFYLEFLLNRITHQERLNRINFNALVLEHEDTNSIEYKVALRICKIFSQVRDVTTYIEEQVCKEEDSIYCKPLKELRRDLPNLGYINCSPIEDEAIFRVNEIAIFEDVSRERLNWIMKTLKESK